MKNVNFVIPAAGLGSRFVEVGYQTPKPLIPALDLPMIFWVLGNIPFVDGDTVTIIIRDDMDLVSAAAKFGFEFKDNIRILKLDYLTEGPAATVELGLKNLDLNQSLVIMNSDQYVHSDLSKYVDELRLSDENLGNMITMTAHDPKWSFVGRDSSGRVNQVIEKVAISNEATIGIYGWSSSELFLDSLNWMRSQLMKVNGEYYVAPAYNYLIQKGWPVSTLNLGAESDFLFGFGTPGDLEKFITLESAGEMKEQVLENLRIMIK
jgi:NDP-sugar pyrophosphorylase family protein